MRARNPLATGDARLPAAVNRGGFASSGFGNGGQRCWLHADTATDPTPRRRHAAAVTRKLRWWRARGLIRKVAKTDGYTLSKNGTGAITASIAIQAVDTAKLMDAA